MCNIISSMNKKYHVLKRTAISLRKSGLSYGEISRKIKVSKGTLSLWLKDTLLNPEQRQRLYTKQVLHLNTGPNSQKNRREREVAEIIKKAASEITTPISLDAYRLFGAALYWAEGTKKNMFEMTNSDPYLILFWVKWLKKIFKIAPGTLKARLNIYSQQSEKQIKKFWSELTSIPLTNFGKTFVKPLSKNYKKNTLYFGTIRIEVPKGTNNRYQVYSWTQVILKSITPKVKLIEKRWSKLQKVARPVNMT